MLLLNYLYFLGKICFILLFCIVGELRQLYKLTPIAVIGGSFFPGLAGHNISEAAAAGCAVLSGKICIMHQNFSLALCTLLKGFIL